MSIVLTDNIQIISVEPLQTPLHTLLCDLGVKYVIFDCGSVFPAFCDNGVAFTGEFVLYRLERSTKDDLRRVIVWRFVLFSQLLLHLEF